MGEGIAKWGNTILLSILTLVVSIASTVMVSNIGEMNDKLDNLMIQTTVNSERINNHNIESGEWKLRIESLESGAADATSDRITKTEALDAIERLREWVEKYYQRK